MGICIVYFRSLSVLQVVSSELGMYCWGSTVHGELGVGAPEVEQLPLPTFMDFTDSWKIVQGKSNMLIQSVCIALCVQKQLLILIGQLFLSYND